jgi:phenylalanyl-tRNA synthetase beta chain
MIEIAITPNRGDCLGVRGIARDLAAAGLGILKPLIVEQEQGSFKPNVEVTIEVNEDCPKFIGCEIRGVKNGPSPAWMQQRLKAIGLRPISALVDITNYISFNLGRPLHVYDVAKLDGNITVRHGREGEEFEALNGKTYQVKPGMTVIADESKVLGLGGIIGGTSSGCDENTLDVFLEVALFNPLNIAKTGRDLSIDTDARYRFERTVDPAGVATGAEQAIRLISAICGGDMSEWCVTGNQPKWHRKINFRPARVESLGGVWIEDAKLKHILQQLGFTIESTKRGNWVIAVPSYRPDVEGEADIVEEILRINGYDNIPTASLPAALSKPDLSFVEKASGLARRTLAMRGFMETCTWAFMRDKAAALFAEHNAALLVANPISSDLNYMRPSILPNLIDAAARNKARGMHSLNLFEVGSQFAGITPDAQRQVAAALRTGDTAPKTAHKEARPVDVYDAKADALAILASTGFDTSKVQVKTEAPSYYHPGRSGSLTLGPKVVLGYFGELHPLVLQEMDYKGRAVACEVFMDAIPAPKAKTTSKPLLQASDYQAVERDFAFLANDNVAAIDIIKAIRASDQALIREVRIFDVYRGKGVEDGKQSVAVSVTLQAGNRTLTDDEIESVSKKIIENAQKQFGGTLRG